MKGYAQTPANFLVRYKYIYIYKYIFMWMNAGVFVCVCMYVCTYMNDQGGRGGGGKWGDKFLTRFSSTRLLAWSSETTVTEIIIWYEYHGGKRAFSPKCAVFRSHQSASPPDSSMVRRFRVCVNKQKKEVKEITDAKLDQMLNYVNFGNLKKNK